MGFVDLHCHLLYDIDDGCDTLKDSIELSQSLSEIGFDTVVCTPHIWPRVFTNAEKAGKRFLKMEREFTERNMPLKLALGGEHYLDGTFWDIIEMKQALPYQNTRYLLVEFPLGKLPYNPHDIIFQLQSRGYYPVLAHPERYEFVQKRPKSLEPLINGGLIVQADILSVKNKFSNYEKTALQALFDFDFYHIVATDAHKPKDIDNITYGLVEIEKWIGKDKLVELLDENPRRILAGKPF